MLILHCSAENDGGYDQLLQPAAAAAAAADDDDDDADGDDDTEAKC